MSAAYDNYDYPSYWIGREYEHQSEVVAIKSFLEKIPKIKNLLDIGAGYGRHVPSYSFRVKNITLCDPSIKLLSIAIKKYKTRKNITFLHSKIENLLNKKKPGSFDLILMVRVLHHIKDIESAFRIVNKLLTDGGYFILEFPNKRHLKAMFKNIISGDITYPLNIFPIDLSTKKSIKKKYLPFINYHPDHVIQILKENGFDVVEIRSVSNIRWGILKDVFPLKLLVDIEKFLQRPFSYINFGPSIFLLFKKRI